MMLPQPNDGLESVADCSLHSVVYLVSSTWWRTRTAPVDNSQLCEGEGLRSGLQRESDYVLVSHAVWEELLQVYGGGPSLPVPVFQGLPDLSVVPFPVTLHTDFPQRRWFLLSLQHSLMQAKVYLCSLLGQDSELYSLDPVEPAEPETPLAVLFPCELQLSRTALDETLSTPRTRSTGKGYAGASSPVLRGWEDEKQPEETRAPILLRSDKAVVQAKVLTAMLLPRLCLRLKPLDLIVRDLALLDKDACVEYEETK